MLGFGHEHPGSTGGSNGSPAGGSTDTQQTSSNPWKDNAWYIRSLVRNGTATPEQQAWYDRWVYSGRPPTKRGMLTQAEMEAKMAREQLAASRPEGVSESLWLHANDGNMSGFNVTSVTRDPEARDALIEAGFGDWVKAVHEQHMDQNAGHAIGNGANEGDAWRRAQLDWYTQNYGEYGNPTVAGDSNIGNLGFGHEQAKPIGTNENPYVPPSYTPPQPPAQQPPAQKPSYSWDLDVGTRESSGSSTPFADAYLRSKGQAQPPVQQPPQQPSEEWYNQGWTNAYAKSKARAEAPGPVSSLFKDYL